MPKPDKNDPLDKVINAMNNPELRQQYLSELGINNNKNRCTYIKHCSNKQRSKKAETLKKGRQINKHKRVLMLQIVTPRNREKLLNQ